MIFDVELVDGDLPPRTRHITGPELTAQRIDQRLGTFLGEWFLDTTVGLRYLEWLDTVPPPVDEMSADVRAQVESTPGVIRTENWVGSFNSATATVTIAGDVVVDDGTVLAVVVEPPALVPGNTSAGSIVTIGQVPAVRGVF